MNFSENNYYTQKKETEVIDEIANNLTTICTKFVCKVKLNLRTSSIFAHG